MKHKKHYHLKHILYIFLVVLLFACKPRVEVSEMRETIKVSDSIQGQFLDIVADSIIYDVIVKNPSSDDAWTAECLKNLNRKKLIDMIFENIYKEKITAFDYSTNKKLNPKEVKNIEKEESFKRENIGKLQFTETWILDSVNFSIYKKVTDVTLGYEYYDSEGKLFGYSPLFKVRFK